MKTILTIILATACSSAIAFAQTTTKVTLSDQLGWAAFEVSVDVPLPTQEPPDYSNAILMGGARNVHFYSLISERAEPTLFSFSMPEIKFANVVHKKTTDGKELYTADILYRFYVTAQITSKTFKVPEKPTEAKVAGLKSVLIQGGSGFSTFTTDFTIQGVAWLIEPTTAEQGAAANP